MLAAQQALVVRVEQVEQRLDQDVHRAEQRAEQRRSRTWLLGLGMLTGIVCPILVTAILAAIHLGG
jgi:hypothetical protein